MLRGFFGRPDFNFESPKSAGEHNVFFENKIHPINALRVDTRSFFEAELKHDMFNFQTFKFVIGFTRTLIARRNR